MAVINAQTQINMTNDLLGLWSEQDNNDDLEVGVSATTTQVDVAYTGTSYTGVYTGTFNPEFFGHADDSLLVNTITGFTETNGDTGLTFNVSGFVFASLADFNAFSNVSVFAGGDAMTGADNNDYIRGYGGGDLIQAAGGADTIFGGIQRVDSADGNDTIHGGDGGDEIYGNSGNDEIYGGGTGSTLDGADLIYGGQGNDTIYGNEGNDSLYGGGDVYSPNDVADTVYGGAGDDSLFGNGGDDVIYGEAGNDWMHGGAGNDTFVFASGGGADTLGKFVSGEDIIHIASNINSSGITTAAAAVSNVTAGSGNVVIDLGSGNSLTVEGVTSLGESDFVII